MTTSIIRTADGWWVQTAYGTARIATSAPTTAELLTHRKAIDAAAHSAHTVPVDGLRLISPVTAPCRVVAQMTNFASHVKGAGMNPKTVPLTFFRKTSGSINGPFDEIIKPPHVKLLDYEVEIGLVIGRDIPVGTEITESNLADFIAGLVVTNDVSARDVQLRKPSSMRPSRIQHSPLSARPWCSSTPTNSTASAICASNCRSTAKYAKTCSSTAT